ncbi:hypothetical protein ABK040_011474 [Willaertia magna]
MGDSDSNNDTQEIIWFSKLPNEMYNEIFKYLNPLDICCTAVNVCKNWRIHLLYCYLKFYLNNYLNNLIFTENVDLFINNLLKDDELFFKFKKYLFNQQVYNLAKQLQNKQSIINNLFYQFNDNIQRELNDLSNYFYLINYNKYFVKHFEINNNNNTTCFGTNKFNNTNNYNNIYNNKDHLNVNNHHYVKKKILIPKKNYHYKDNNKPLIHFKSVLTGNLNVGKTSFARASLFKTFNTYYNALSSATFIKQHTLNNLTFKMDFWDTAGQERFKSLAPMYYRGANIFFICFDLTDKNSFENVRKWKEEIDRNVGEGVLYEIILLGLKSDLQKELIIEKKEVEKVAFELEMIYLETSSKLMENVDIPTWFAVLMKYFMDDFIKRMSK